MTDSQQVFTGNDVVEWLERKVVFEPERRNVASVGGVCVYSDRSGNRCIVGEWLSDVCGIEDDWLRNSDNYNVSAETIVRKAAKIFGFGLTRSATVVLETAQQAADQQEVSGYAAFTDSSAALPRITWDSAVQLTLRSHAVQRALADANDNTEIVS